MFFRKKLITIYENENFKVEIEKKIKNVFDIVGILNQFIKGELKKESSDLIQMLIFLEKIEICLSDKEHIAHISSSDIDNIIYLNNLEVISDIIMIFKHELVHLFHKKKSYMVTYIQNKLTSLSKYNLAQKMFPSLLERGYILHYFYNIILEGFPKYIEEKEKLSVIYLENYEGVKKEVIFLNYGIFASINNRELLNCISLNKTAITSNIGLQVIFTILHKSKNKIYFFELIEMSFKKILELYEDVMVNEVKLQPLITYSSEKGIIDYKRTIREWHELRKKEKN